MNHTGLKLSGTHLGKIKTRLKVMKRVRPLLVPSSSRITLNEIRVRRNCLETNLDTIRSVWAVVRLRH